MRIGQTFFKNTDFIYYAIQKGIVKLDEALSGSTLHTAHPPELGEMLLSGEIDIAPVSSIIYAQHPADFLLLPNFSISAFGETGSILLFSKKCSSPKELEGRKVAVPGTSASSSVLLQILLKSRNIDAEIVYQEKPEIKDMLHIADAALLIGDDALIANSRKNRLVCDLGEEWKALTGKKMVYALWIIRKKFAEENPEQLKIFHEKLRDSEEYAYRNIDAISQELASRISISPEVMKEHLLKLNYGFDKEDEKGLKEYFKYAKKFGIIKEMPRLKFFEV